MAGLVLFILTLWIGTNPASTQLPSCICGGQIYADQAEKIVGGQTAGTNEYPWMASLSLKNVGFFCGASLINDQYVLTAAHCLEGIRRPRSVKIRLGSNNRRKPNSSAILRNGEKLIIHPGYKSGSLYNDVGLIQLDEPVTFGRNAAPICLPGPPAPNLSGTDATVVGWGRISYRGQLPRILRELSVQILSNRVCQAAWRNLGGRIQPSMVCTNRKKGWSNMGTCNGDSGGPLMVRTGRGRWTQIGLVSFGISGACGDSRYPDVYTRLSSYYRFIAENTADAGFCSV